MNIECLEAALATGYHELVSYQFVSGYCQFESKNISGLIPYTPSTQYFGTLVLKIEYFSLLENFRFYCVF